MAFRMKVIIVGAGGHAKVVSQCIDENIYEIIGFLDKDDSRVGEKIEGIPIVGSDKDGEYYRKTGVEGCFIAIGHVGSYALRNRLFEEYEKLGFVMINAIHKSSILARNAKIGKGVVVMPNATINADAKIGNNVIINTGAIVEHDVQIGDGVHIAPGCIIAGETIISSNVFIGAGTTVIQGRYVGENTIIGAGSVVIKDIQSNVVAVGQPAQVIKEV